MHPQKPESCRAFPQPSSDPEPPCIPEPSSEPPCIPVALLGTVLRSRPGPPLSLSGQRPHGFQLLGQKEKKTATHTTASSFSLCLCLLCKLMRGLPLNCPCSSVCWACYLFTLLLGMFVLLVLCLIFVLRLLCSLGSFQQLPKQLSLL